MPPMPMIFDDPEGLELVLELIVPGAPEASREERLIEASLLANLITGGVIGWPTVGEGEHAKA
jgi:hypothetical protein